MVSDFSERLTDLRNEKKLSQKEAASDLMISQALLSHYEKGIRECGLEFLCRAADYYNVTTDYILGRTESRSGLSDTDLEDREEDGIFNPATVYRAALMGHERVESGGSSAGETVYTVYALMVYRALLVASRRGYIPKRWFGLTPKYADCISAALCNSLLAELPDKQADAKRRGGAQPLCLETLIKSVEDYLQKSAQAL